MKLSPNFSLKEMTASQTPIRKDINNNPSEDHMNALKHYVKTFYKKSETTIK